MASPPFKADFRSNLFQTDWFFYRNVDKAAPNKPGVYFWYLCPEITDFTSSKDVTNYLEKLQEANLMLEYTFETKKGKFLQGKITPCPFNIISEDEIGEADSSEDPESTAKLDLGAFINNPDKRRLLRHFIPIIFSQIAPIRVGVAANTLKSRLKNYSDKHRIEEVIKRDPSNLFSLDSCVIRTVTFSEDFKEHEHDFMYLMEKLVLKWALPISNIKRGT